MSHVANMPHIGLTWCKQCARAPYPLTDDQRRAIVVDEENCLLVAGAGTGKTSTIVGKAGYLIEKGLAAPEEIRARQTNQP